MALLFWIVLFCSIPIPFPFKWLWIEPPPPPATQQQPPTTHDIDRVAAAQQQIQQQQQQQQADATAAAHASFNPLVYWRQQQQVVAAAAAGQPAPAPHSAALDHAQGQGVSVWNKQSVKHWLWPSVLGGRSFISWRLLFLMTHGLCRIVPTIPGSSYYATIR